MKKIKINGKEYFVEKETTVYEFLKNIGIYVPTLCYHPYLRPVGSCRICIIKDRGRYKNSCATLIEDGMDIETHTPDLIEARRWILQFLFGERNHYCMYCAVTNDCEFQNLGYYVGLDHFHFPTFKNIFELDNSHEFILFDNNRCVLCSRCIRVCSEVGGHFVLSEINKGINSLIVADGGIPLGKSSCVSCGLCVQVCPTGTFIDKYSMYLGRSWETEKINSFCFSCPVACGIEIRVRNGNIVKVLSNWESFTKGLICYKGRYSSVIKHRNVLQNRKHFRNVNIIQDSYLIESIRTKSSVALIDGTLFNEEIQKITEIFGTENTYCLYKINPKINNNKITFDELDKYDAYIIYGWNLDKDYGTIGSVIKRNYRLKNKKMFRIEEVKDFIKNSIFIYPACFEYINNKRFWEDEIVLPTNTNDIGVLKYIGNKYLDEELVKEFDKIFIFTRNSDVLPLYEKDCYLFTYTDRQIEGFKEVFLLPSEYEIDGTFYNVFNQLISVKSITKEGVL